MGMGRAGSYFQNAANTINANGPVQSGMGGKGKGGGSAQPSYPSQGGMGGKGGGSARPSYPPQSGMGGKGKGGGQPLPQPPTQPPTTTPPTQPTNTPPQQYYTPQYQPDTFQNPYAQVGFGQQMGGMGGKGRQMGRYQQMPPWMQGGMGGKGGQMGNYPQQPLQQNQYPQQQWSGFNYQGRPPQNQGLASLQQPTATTEALTPTPASDQPYMGNYLQ